MDTLVIGSIIWVESTVAPPGTAEAAGQVVPLYDHQELYSLIGNKYGGQSPAAFRLPDLRPKDSDGRPDLNWGGGPRAVIVIKGTMPQKDAVIDSLFIGSIMWLAFDWAPMGTLFADGRTMPAVNYEALWSLTPEYKYDARWRRTFLLPDLRPKGSDGRPYPNWNGGPKAVIVCNGLYPEEGHRLYPSVVNKNIQSL